MILSKPNYIKIYGHRGARGVFPENTLDSFQYLFDNNISAYETDILISKDLVSERSELNAGAFIREMAKHIRGGGGGQPFYASAGGSNPNGLDQAVQTIKELI